MIAPPRTITALSVPQASAQPRAQLRLRSLAWALQASAVAGLVPLVPLALAALRTETGPQPLTPALVAGLELALRAGGCGFFYGLLAFHLQRVDPDDGHLQAGLVGAVCGIRSLGAGGGAEAGALLQQDANLIRLAPSLMMELARAWLPLWLPLVGSALLLHAIRRLTPYLLPTLRP